MASFPWDVTVTADRRKRRLLASLALAVLIPSVGLCWVTIRSIPRQAEARKTTQLREAEKILYYHERDLEQLSRDKATAAAKDIGIDRLLDGDPQLIRAALKRAEWASDTFDSIRLEASARRSGKATSAPSAAERASEWLDDAATVAAAQGQEAEDTVPLASSRDRFTGVLHYRFSCKYAHGTLLREYFEKETAAMGGNWVLRAREPGGRLLYESSESVQGPFDVSRGMSTPSFRGIVLELRSKEGPIDQEVRRWAIGQTALILFLDLLLGAGLVLVYANVKREMMLSRLKSDFVANVSHELKTPLALIRLFAETLELGRVSGGEKATQYSRIINKESQRLTQLINNILDFSRIEAGRKEYRFVATDLTRVIQDVVESYRFPIEQQGFALQVDVAELPEVEVDPDAIAQALINLVNNAIKYSRDDKRITITARRDGDLVRLSIADRGIGIPRVEQKKIFEKFYRAESSLVHDTKGSGLGLSLVNHIVEAHGGSIEVESAPGRGSTFTLVLPVRRERPLEEKEPHGRPAVVAAER